VAKLDIMSVTGVKAIDYIKHWVDPTVSDHALLVATMVDEGPIPRYIGSRLVYPRKVLIEHYRVNDFDPCENPESRILPR
jgi:hypothetical protein